MKVIIIDDEPLALEPLKALLADYEGIEIAGCYSKPEDALEELDDVCPDAVFLDIEMGAVNGLEIAEYFMNKHNDLEIVFCTAYSDYAVEAFELSAIDYLLKPVQKKRLDKTIRRLKEKKEKIKANIQSFGSLSVFDSSGKPIRWRTKKTKELFAYLWMNNGKFINKMKILETIFFDKDIDNGLTLLYTTIYQLRKILGQFDCESSLYYLNDGYQLKISVKSDQEVLNNLLGHERNTGGEIRDILALYQGDFLEEEGYEWCMAYQQWYKNKVFQALERFAVPASTQEILPEVLEDCLMKMYKIDIFNENVAKMVISYYGKQKKRERLRSFFETYKQNIYEELEIEPSKSILQFFNDNMKE